jgi:aminoglycoside phosphotransferase (APT) family kinase protein
MTDVTPDPMAILAALGVTEATAAIPVRGGQDTVIWRVDAGGQRYALRLFRAGEERKCRREVASMRAAVAGGIPVPTVHSEAVWEGRPALLLSWVPGRTVVEAFRAQPWRIAAFGALCGRMHARIHAIPAPEGPEYPPDRWLDWGMPLDAPLRERVRAIARPSVLCHFDYHPLNVMTDGARVTAVLDWPNALPGDPRADLARTVALLRFPPNTRLRAHEMLAIRLFLRAWWRAYQRAGGRVTDMAPFYAWAGTMTLLDQEAKLDRPNIPRSSASFDPLRRWTAMWRRRAGLPPMA